MQVTFVFLGLMALLYRLDFPDRRKRGRRRARGGHSLHVGPTARSHTAQRNRKAVRAIEEAIAEGRDIATLPDAKLYFERVAYLVRTAERRFGRTPLRREVHLLVQEDLLLRGLSLWGLSELMDATGKVHRSLTDEERRWVTEHLPSGAVRRHVNLSLRFLPVAERGRYRSEWEAEIAAMSPAEADVFARGVLRFALRSGLVLRLSRIFGRQAA